VSLAHNELDMRFPDPRIDVEERLGEALRGLGLALVDLDQRDGPFGVYLLDVIDIHYGLPDIVDAPLDGPILEERKYVRIFSRAYADAPPFQVGPDGPQCRIHDRGEVHLNCTTSDPFERVEAHLLVHGYLLPEVQMIAP